MVVVRTKRRRYFRSRIKHAVLSLKDCPVRQEQTHDPSLPSSIFSFCPTIAVDHRWSRGHHWERDIEAYLTAELVLDASGT